MKIAFSFDDGRADALDASKILNSYGLVASFHVVTGFIDGTFISDEFGYNRKPLSFSDLNEMKMLGMRISSHGDKHLMDIDDFRNSYRKLKDANLIDDKCGFSIPFSQYNENQLKEFVNNNEDTLSYVRVGRNSKCYTIFSKINYVLYHIFKNQLPYNLFNKYNLMDNIDRYHLYSLVIKKDCKAKNINKFIKKYANKDASLIIMFHSIVDNPKDTWEYSTEEFKSVCQNVVELRNRKSVETLTIEELINEQ